MYTYLSIYVLTYLPACLPASLPPYLTIFTTEGFFEVAIESWFEWNLSPQRVNSVETL